MFKIKSLLHMTTAVRGGRGTAGIKPSVRAQKHTYTEGVLPLLFFYPIEELLFFYFRI